MKATKQINKSVMIYIIGCRCFVLVALASLWFGYYVIRYHNDHKLPVQLTIISLGGGLLLWEMIKSFRFRVSLPKILKHYDSNTGIMLVGHQKKKKEFCCTNLLPLGKVSDFLCSRLLATLFYSRFMYTNNKTNLNKGKEGQSSSRHHFFLHNNVCCKVINK